MCEVFVYIVDLANFEIPPPHLYQSLVTKVCLLDSVGAIELHAPLKSIENVIVLK